MKKEYIAPTIKAFSFGTRTAILAGSAFVQEDYDETGHADNDRSAKEQTTLPSGSNVWDDEW